MAQTRIKDMTEGKPLRLMLSFSVPMLLSNILQLFYTMADSAVVGRMLGVEAFAAVGATVSLHWLAMSSVMSMEHGFGFIFAQRFGAKDMDGLRRTFVTASCLSVMFGIALGCAGALGSGFVLRLLGTPIDLLDGAATYFGWLLGGVIITFAYNQLSAMLRAMGDSKTPLRAMIFSSLLNIVLDIALVGPLGIAGVAAATLTAQLFAGVYCFIVLRRTGVLEGAVLKWDGAAAVALLRLGVPLSIRDSVIEVGGLVAQVYINGYGMAFIAGVAAAKRMYSLLVVAGSAFEAACATFAAQNFGAGKFGRVRQGVVIGRRLMLASAVIIMAFTLPLRRVILGLLLEGDAAQVSAVLDVGSRQLTIMTIGLPLLYLLVLYRSALEGIGKPFFPVLSGFVELACRIVSVVFLTPFIGEMGVLLSDATGWVAASALLVVSYTVISKRLGEPKNVNTIP